MQNRDFRASGDRRSPPKERRQTSVEVLASGAGRQWLNAHALMVPSASDDLAACRLQGGAASGKVEHVADAVLLHGGHRHLGRSFATARPGSPLRGCDRRQLPTGSAPRARSVRQSCGGREVARRQAVTSSGSGGCGGAGGRADIAASTSHEKNGRSHKCRGQACLTGRRS